MHTFGRNARPDEGESATFGNLSLVGVRGKFRIEITQRQLILSNDVRKGIKLDLASISRTRSIDIPTVPSGVIVWGSAACYLGATILIPPLGYAVSLLGGLSVLSHFIFKTPALVIETNIGDRHIIQSRLNDQEVLLKVHMMIEKVSNGQSVRDAKNSMEREFSYQNKENVIPKALLNAPIINELVPEVREEIQAVESFGNISENVLQNNFERVDMPFFDNQEAIIESQFSTSIPEMKHNEVEGVSSAYEQTWGRNEPHWYNEKKPISRLESSLEDVTETMETDLFGFNFGEGGLFDSEPAKSSSDEPVNYSSPEKNTIPEQYTKNHQRNSEPLESIFGTEYSMEEMNSRRSMSSAEMIRVANGMNRSPVSSFSNSMPLPEPTDEAVRIECKPGLVKRAKAQQSLHRKAEIIASLPAPTDLGEFPGLSRMASSYEEGRLSVRKLPVKRKRVGLIERLLVPRYRSYERKSVDYSTEYGDPDGVEVSSGARFQSKQHLRIRSDQEHQADINNRITRINSTEPSTAKDALDRVVNRVSRGEEHSPTELGSEQPLLRFNQMRRTSNSNEKGHLKGIKRLN